MANFSNGPVQTAAWINKAIGDRKATAEMIIVPISGIDSSSDIIALLCGLAGFAAPGAGAASGSVGSLQLSNQRTVDDALRDMAGTTMIVHEIEAALESVVEVPVDGVTVELKTHMGVFLIDRFAFAKRSNLALQAKVDSPFTAFIREVPERRNGEGAPSTRKFFVAVRGSGPATLTAPAAVPATAFTQLEERSKSRFEIPLSFNLQGVQDGWQLLAMARFDEVLGWLRGGYIHAVERCKDGLTFGY